MGFSVPKTGGSSWVFRAPTLSPSSKVPTKRFSSPAAFRRYVEKADAPYLFAKAGSRITIEMPREASRSVTIEGFNKKSVAWVKKEVVGDKVLLHLNIKEKAAVEKSDTLTFVEKAAWGGKPVSTRFTLEVIDDAMLPAKPRR